MFKDMFTKLKSLSFLASCFAILIVFPSAIAKNSIFITGSSTVFPFASIIAERVTKIKSIPVFVESMGSGGGLKLFCKGLNEPHIVNASRRITISELRRCKKYNIDVIEFTFGKDGVVISNSKKSPLFNLSEELIFTALAEDNGFGKKPMTWKEAGLLIQHKTALPDMPIRVYGPPDSSGTRHAFIDLIMKEGAKKLSQRFHWDWDKQTYTEKSTIFRDDTYINVGENDNLTIQKLYKNPESLGITGFSYLDNNLHLVQGALINGVDPSFENISSGRYPAARALFFYVKKYYVSMLLEYLREFISIKMIGEDGYLVEKGLIPLSEEQFQIQLKKIETLPELVEEDLVESRH